MKKGIDHKTLFKAFFECHTRNQHILLKDKLLVKIRTKKWIKWLFRSRNNFCRLMVIRGHWSIIKGKSPVFTYHTSSVSSSSSTPSFYDQSFFMIVFTFYWYSMIILWMVNIMAMWWWRREEDQLIIIEMVHLFMRRATKEEDYSIKSK